MKWKHNQRTMKSETFVYYLACSLLGSLLLLVDTAAGACANVVNGYDVVVIGGGMSGISAAAQLIEDQIADLSVVVLESTNRIGGRVKSKKDFGKGGPDGKTDWWTIEEGANWQFSYEGNEVFELLQEYDIKYTHTNFLDFNKSTYQYHDYLPRAFAKLIPPETVDTRFKEYLEANDCVNNITLPYYVIPTRNFLNPDFPPEKDVGVVKLLEECGWIEEEPVDFAIQWNWIDYEWAARDPSTREWPYDAYEFPVYMISDPRGFEYLPQRYSEESGVCMDATKGMDAVCPEGIVRFDQRVTEIEYDLNPGVAGAPKVMVTAENSDGSCTAYTGLRAVVAVSAGVLNQGKIKFTPPLLYSATDSGSNPNSNPIKQRQFVKLFFQFPKKFWPDGREFMMTLKENELRENVQQFGECQQWQILDIEVDIVQEGSSPELLPGSKTLMCVLATESFERLIDPTTGTIPKEVVYKKLLDRLRRTFRGYVDPTSYYAVDTKNNEDWGNGAYGSWLSPTSAGKQYSVTDYYRFFGGAPFNDTEPKLVEYCEHNGCNCDFTDAGCTDPEWTLHISGAISCFELYEVVDGAFAAGKRTANAIISDITGDDLGDDSFSICDDVFFFDTSILDP